MRLVVVTLTRNNIPELELTSRSVALQSVRPTRHLIVDGSDPAEAREASQIAEKFGAEYFWKPPEGIYGAMNSSLSLLEPDDWVLWLNSSDWFAGPDAVKAIYDSHPDSSNVAWLMGLLVRRSTRELKFHRRQWRGEDLLPAMRIGATGFPHPSVVFSAGKILELAGYEISSWLRIAADYDLALRFGARYGSPGLIQKIISVHVPAGFSSENQIRGFIERLISRLRRTHFREKLVAALYLPFAAMVALFSAVELKNKRDFRPHESQIPGHYCDDSGVGFWPYCCDQALMVSHAYPDLGQDYPAV